MKKIEAIVRPSKTELIKDTLSNLGIEDFIVTEIKGFGRQKGHIKPYPGSEYHIEFLPKAKFEITVENDQAFAVRDAIVRAAKTGKYGDGKVFIIGEAVAQPAMGGL